MNFHTSLMSLYDTLDDGEADACAWFVLVSLIEGTENLFLVFFRNARTIVADSNDPSCIVGLHSAG